MRHKHKRVLEINSWIHKSRTVLRNMLTSLILHGSITTTAKKSRSLKSFADSFFSRLVRIQSRNPDAAKRDSIMYIRSVLYSEVAWKKVMSDLLPKFVWAKKNSWFVSNYKLWFRSWDAAEAVLVKLV